MTRYTYVSSKSVGVKGKSNMDKHLWTVLKYLFSDYSQLWANRQVLIIHGQQLLSSFAEKLRWEGYILPHALTVFEAFHCKCLVWEFHKMEKTRIVPQRKGWCSFQASPYLSNFLWLSLYKMIYKDKWRRWGKRFITEIMPALLLLPIPDPVMH